MKRSSKPKRLRRFEAVLFLGSAAVAVGAWLILAPKGAGEPATHPALEPATQAASNPPGSATSRTRAKTHHPPPERVREPAPDSEKLRSDRFPATPAGQAVAKHLHTLGEVGDRDEMAARTAASFDDLRQHAEEASLLLYDEFRRAGDVPMAQFAALHSLAELGSEYAYEPLKEIARSEIEHDPNADPHHDFELTHERTLRQLAIDGLATLAADGSDEARLELFAMARDPAYDAHRDVKVSAIRGYVGTGPRAQERAERLRPDVRADFAWALEPPGDLSRENMIAILAQAPTTFPTEAASKP